MSEEKTKYETEIQDAMEMLGKGYDQPTVIIEPPRTTTARHNGKMVEIEEPAWVKFSTDFKKELIDLNEFSLKVFLYIGLSVNWRTGEAYPGIRKIASETGMDKDTAAKAVQNLEERGFLQVFRREGNSNIYTPVRYIAIGTVRPEGTVTDGVSDETAELSLQTSELSLDPTVKVHNKNNKKNKKNLSSEDFEKAGEMVKAMVTNAQRRDAWKFRETFKKEHYVYADWWHEISGQPINKAQVRTCQKAFQQWEMQGIEFPALFEAYNSRVKWKKVISDPNELTKDAAAIQALPAAKQISVQSEYVAI